MRAEPTEEFLAQRPKLFGLAYRMLGSAQDAEDIVQDAFLRWARADRAAIAAPSAWLLKVVTNLCLSRLKLARVHREQYVGPWLPEPLLTEDSDLGPLETAEQRESVSMGLLVLLERLTAAERAVFVLREAFQYSHHEIAEILDLSEVNCRQLHHRARQQVRLSQSRFRPAPSDWRQLVDSFLAAAETGDVPGLERLFAADVTAWADGGGSATAARRPVTGRGKVARYLAGLVRKYAVQLEVRTAEVNGDPGVVALAGGVVIGALAFQLRDGQIAAVRTVASPDKLGYINKQLARQLQHTSTV